MCISTSFRFLFFLFGASVSSFVIASTERLRRDSMRVCMLGICAVCQLWFDQMKMYERICMVRGRDSVKSTKTLTRSVRWWWILLDARVQCFFFCCVKNICDRCYCCGGRRRYCCRKFRCVWHDLVSHFGHSFPFSAVWSVCINILMKEKKAARVVASQR